MGKSSSKLKKKNTSKYNKIEEKLNITKRRVSVKVVSTKQTSLLEGTLAAA
jgi:hypothetical protein